MTLLKAQKLTWLPVLHLLDKMTPRINFRKENARALECLLKAFPGRPYITVVIITAYALEASADLLTFMYGVQK